MKQYLQNKSKIDIINNKQVIRQNNKYGKSNYWRDTSERLQSDCKLYVKQFSGARTKCMKDYMKPSLRENPDYFILHAGINDLNTNRSPELISKRYC